MKICRKLYNKRYRESIKGKNTQKRYLQTERGKITSRKAQQRYCQTERGKIVHCRLNMRYQIRYPERYKARQAVRAAIRKGKLPRPNTCQCHYCSIQAKEYHHPNYKPENWLSVLPICKECHTELHKKVA